MSVANENQVQRCILLIFILLCLSEYLVHLRGQFEAWNANMVPTHVQRGLRWCFHGPASSAEIRLGKSLFWDEGDN